MGGQRAAPIIDGPLLDGVMVAFATRTSLNAQEPVWGLQWAHQAQPQAQGLHAGQSLVPTLPAGCAEGHSHPLNRKLSQGWRTPRRPLHQGNTAGNGHISTAHTAATP